MIALGCRSLFPITESVVSNKPTQHLVLEVVAWDAGGRQVRSGLLLLLVLIYHPILCRAAQKAIGAYICTATTAPKPGQFGRLLLFS